MFREFEKYTKIKIHMVPFCTYVSLEPEKVENDT